ncbi:hypothetical protein NYP20_16385 [Pseudomonas sp. N3-W]|uniref:hypothetical protein n=1 Tax=Pseudomonas sp. N3-W TaxID=2975049 RepID=UPI00217D1B82|nr:hypothetical protein [Pseudomonas sp. N3-W]UWF46928.1 hypothetical protein NYP20_16385 [Pseudomonas sp. N3-W]
MDIAAAYRLCFRTQALKRGLRAVQGCLSKQSERGWLVEETAIDVFHKVEGYRVSTPDVIAFFPKNLSVPVAHSGLVGIRDDFLSVDIVVPVYYQMGMLDKLAFKIHRASTIEEKLKIADAGLIGMFDCESLAALVEGVYRKKRTMNKYADQINESIKAYFLGLHGVAITGLIPCVEGIIRTMGNDIGLSVGEKVDARSLLRVFKKLKQQEVDSALDGYGWYPEQMNVAFFERFHERIQMLGNVVIFIETALYQHTSLYTRETLLNRHGISHGLFEGYASVANFLRLINLINSLSAAAILVEGCGSFFHPPVTEESKKLAWNYRRCWLLKSSVS